MSLAGWLINFMTRKSATRFETATRSPQEVQTEKLLGMMRRNADTEYGRRYGFGHIRSIKDFRTQVPVITYDDIKSDMERLVAGEPNIFTTETR